MIPIHMRAKAIFHFSGTNRSSPVDLVLNLKWNENEKRFTVIQWLLRSRGLRWLRLFFQRIVLDHEANTRLRRCNWFTLWTVVLEVVFRYIVCHGARDLDFLIWDVSFEKPLKLRSSRVDNCLIDSLIDYFYVSDQVKQISDFSS